MSKFNLFNDNIIAELSIARDSVFVSDIEGAISVMSEKGEFVVSQNGKMISCRIIPPNSFFTFKETMLTGYKRISMITDMKRLCKNDKKCVFENRDGDKYSIMSAKITGSTITLYASNIAIISQESLLDM